MDDKPLILDVNYFLKSAVPGLTKEIAENSIYAYLEQELKMQIVTSKRKITVEKATPQSLHQPEYFSFHDTATRKKAAT